MFIPNKILALQDGFIVFHYYQVYIFFCIAKEFIMESLVSNSVGGFCDKMLKEVASSILSVIVA